MTHIYISLGYACNAATMLRRARLRSQSYPFDWLLNDSLGLSAVSDIIRNDFKSVVGAEVYVEAVHPSIGKPLSAYKKYPSVFHVHSDPSRDSAAHEDLVRRYRRLSDALTSPNKLHFVYYRSLSGDRLFDRTATAQNVADKMAGEALEFLEVVTPLRRGETHILLVLETDIEDVASGKQAVKSFKGNAQMSMAATLSRYDDVPALNQRWQDDWIHALIRHSQMPFFLRGCIGFRHSCRKIRRYLINLASKLGWWHSRPGSGRAS